MNPLEAILQALNIITKINSKKQLLALGMILVASIWSFDLFYSEKNDRITVDRDIEAQINIVRFRLGVESISVFEISPDSNQLNSIWQWKPQIKSDDLTEFYRVELFQQLRQGDCYIAESVAKNENGVFLPGLVCPIIRRGRLIGAIAGIYYTLPIKDSRGDIDPDGAELYRLGTYLSD
jgi:hypothetical protein